MSTGKRFSTVKKVAIVLLPVMVCLTGIGGCIEQASVSNLNLTILRTRAAEAYTSGFAAIMREPVSSVDEIWVLREILKLTPDEVLQQFVNDKAASLRGDSFMRLIDPNVSRVDLPADPCSGFTRFYGYVLAPFGRHRNFTGDLCVVLQAFFILLSVTEKIPVLSFAFRTLNDPIPVGITIEQKCFRIINPGPAAS